MLSAVKRFLRCRLLMWIELANKEAYARRFEKVRPFRPNMNVKLEYADGLYKMSEGDMSIFVARKSRLHFNLLGIQKRQAQLQAEYLLNSELIRSGDLVIDCGANVGEFSMICAKAGAQVIAFEPDPREFMALAKNAEGREIQPIQRALWKEDGELTFFDSNDDGDSSLIDPGTSSQSFNVRTQRLDAVPELPSGPIRLIKLEAEGAEPEILEGMKKTLERIEYLTVDMGPERGVKKENTVAEVTNALYAAGFQMIEFFPPRCTGLFKRIA